MAIWPDKYRWRMSTNAKKQILGSKAIEQVEEKPRDLQFWSGLMNINDQFLTMGTFRVQGGKK
jgi:hypothetical protein